MTERERLQKIYDLIDEKDRLWKEVCILKETFPDIFGNLITYSKKRKRIAEIDRELVNIGFYKRGRKS